MDRVLRRSVVRANDGAATRGAGDGVGGRLAAAPVVDLTVGARCPEGPAVLWLVDEPALGDWDPAAVLCRGLAPMAVDVLECHSAAAFFRQYDPARVGCVLATTALPSMCGLSLLSHASASGLAVPVILLLRDARFDVAVAGFRAGAVDVLVAPLDADAVRARIRPVIERERARRAARAGRAVVLERLASLTARERTVLDGLLEGHSSKEIAAGLAISTRTVECHRAHVLEKLEAASTGHALRMVLLARAP